MITIIVSMTIMLLTSFPSDLLLPTGSGYYSLYFANVENGAQKGQATCLRSHS